MKTVKCICSSCGKEQTRVTFTDETDCHMSVCCSCCEKQHLQPSWCKMAKLEMKRFEDGKELNENDIKGLLLEKAVSDSLKAMDIPHKSNPFNNTYPCYQNKSPDIIIPKLDIVIECKNLSKKQVNHLTRKWLNRNIIERNYNKGYAHKRVLFSYKPRKPLLRYLNKHGWRSYGLGTQILTFKEERKAVGKLVRMFYWLKREYYGDRLSKPNQQTRLKPDYLQETVL